MLHHMLRAAAQRAFQTLDPYFQYVTMLLHGDGTNGAQNNTFLDSSTNNFTITRNGNTTQGTFTPYGSNWSNYFDGSSYFTSSTSQIVPTGSFTVECLVYVTSTGNQCFVAQGTSGNAGRFSLCIENSLWFAQIGSASINTGTPVANTWNYLAVTFNGSTLTLYVNGTSIGTASTGTSAQNTTLAIGTLGASWATSGYFVTGYISNVRVSSVVRTIATPTAPYTSDASTKVLFCQSNRFVDASSNAYAFSISAGSPSVQRFSPFIPTTAYSTSVIGGSGYFDGTGDYLTTPSSASISNFSGDFTIEGWVYLNATTAYGVLIGGDGSSGWYVEYGSARGFGAYDGSTFLNGSSTAVTNQWVNFAVTRASGTVRFFINGALTASASSANFNVTQSLGIAAYSGGSSSLNGYLSNIRINNTTALYTSAFTPSTTPLTAVTNTSLLLSTTNAGILDNAMMNNLETVGNAQISTSVKKYGTGSLAFDGSGDYLVPNYPTSDIYSFGTGAYTVEFWIYFNSTATTYLIYDTRPSGVNGNYPTIYFDSSAGFINFYFNGAIRISGNVATASGAWHHVALCRSGSSTKLFINGTQSGSTYTDSNNYLGSVNRPVIGGDGNALGSNGLNGYIDDLRITKGVARYTATFTPPTAAFPNN
jgi:hypothetical protein